jgi:hypothetical protein
LNNKLGKELGKMRKTRRKDLERGEIVREVK